MTLTPPPPPPDPIRGELWRSSVRWPWLTAVLGSVLLVGMPVIAPTGLLSYAQPRPRLQADW